jgi:CRP-like cAMP-binding protein
MMKYPGLYSFAVSKCPITMEEWLLFEPLLTQHHFKKGEILIRPGTPADQIYVVLKGLARNYHISPSGREFTKVIRGEGGLLGPYQEILSGTETKYFVQALTDIEALGFSYKAFDALMARSHAWERMGRIFAQDNYLEKEKREFMLLHMTAEERYEEFLKEFHHYKDEIPQYQVANYLGISPEALNRMLKKK